jgi:hypothetical protein
MDLLADAPGQANFSARELDPGLHAFRLLVPVDLGETG